MNNIDRAYEYYKAYIQQEDLMNLLSEYNLKTAGSVPSVLWELFGAMLTGRKGTGTTGADLLGWEVKSATVGSSFEYQYHLNTGAHKILEDCEVNHLFCSYSKDYKCIDVRVMTGSELADSYFKAWEPLYYKNYQKNISSDLRRQRFRKSISYGFVEKNGTLILQINDGNITLRQDEILDFFNKSTGC
ncbi:hypothetical protein RC77_05470 [Pectobacterium brasiliense]|uniref:hypothetical protein n=1 Tax=Pectobacterium brasiliense TaxID=180957 RepID=UPI00057CBE62|nr:hypothetical protein [Pectobacterium brasiliense]KHS70963.1 hypothetical protein RC77_05470 [Pectobacterium brasiliense]